MESTCSSILTALQPLLLNDLSAEMIKNIQAKLVTFSSNQQLLATCLNTFCTTLLAIPNTDSTRQTRLNLFRDLANKLVYDNHLRSDILYEAIDKDVHQVIQPSINTALETRRIRTRNWFTQPRFNLFHEESEGYAKLLQLIWDCVIANDENHVELWSRMIAVIGRFSLDPTRVIELTLSATMEVLNEQISKRANLPYDHRLPKLFSGLLDEFDKQLIISVVGAMFQAYHPTKTTSDSTNNTNEQTESTNTTNSSGESDIVTPGSFFCLVVVLIREGCMSVQDIWPYLLPKDNSELVNIMLEYENQLDELTSEVCSPKLVSQAIENELKQNDDAGSGPSDRDILYHFPVISNGPRGLASHQKIRLIAHFINMLRWDDALSAILLLDINGQHIDIASDPSIASSVTRIIEVLLHPMLYKLYPEYFSENKQLCEAISHLGGRQNGCPALIYSVDEFLDPDENSAGALIRQFLCILGPHVRASYKFFQTLIRLLPGRKEPTVVELMQEVVLPAASLLTSSGTIVNSIWNVLREWPHTTRWNLYGHFQYISTYQSAIYRIMASRASYETRYIMKRLTADTHKVYAQAVGKITRGQGVPAFEAILDRIQGYPADFVIISPVVDACRRCVPLSTDLLLFMLIDRMADSRRSRLKEDGINIAQWYSTISLFLGLAIRKMYVQPSHLYGVFSFFYTKLAVEDEPLLVTALSDIINCVSNVEIDTNLSARQIAAYGGGRYIREVTGSTWTKLSADAQYVCKAFDFRAEKEKRSAAYTLYRTFKKTEFHTYIAIAVAQLLRTATYQEEIRAAPLKLGANIIDRARICLMQLSSFLGSLDSIQKISTDSRYNVWDELQKIGIGKLIEEMGLSISSACMLMAPVLDFIELLEHNATNSTAVTTSGEVTTSTADEKNSKDEKSIKEQKKEEGEEDDMEVDEIRTPQRSIVGADANFIRIINDRTKGLLPDIFVRVFWAMKLSDLRIPLELYKSEVDRLKVLQAFWSNHSTKFNAADPVELEKKKKCLQEHRHMELMEEELEHEKKIASERQEKVAEVFKKHAKQLHIERNTSANEKRIIQYFLQDCLLPRSKVSQPDALFCHQFVLKLLDLDIPSLNYSFLFKDLMYLVPITLQSCTENEAHSFTFLIKEIMTTLEKWRSNRKLFDAEAANGKKHGFSIDNKPMPHERFCQWLYNIHQQLTEGLCRVLDSEEFLNVRNCITLLTGVSEVFPKVSEHSSIIEKQIETLTHSILPDIRLSSTAVLARLKSFQARRLPEHIFKLKPVSSKIGGLAKSAALGIKRGEDASNVKGSTTNSGPSKASIPVPDKKPSPQRGGPKPATPEKEKRQQDERVGQRVSPNERKRPAPAGTDRVSPPEKRRHISDDMQQAERKKQSVVETEKHGVNTKPRAAGSERQKPPPGPTSYDRHRSLGNEQRMSGAKPRISPSRQGTQDSRRSAGGDHRRMGSNDGGRQGSTHSRPSSRPSSQPQSRQTSPKKGVFSSANGNDNRSRPSSQHQPGSSNNTIRRTPPSDGGAIRDRGQRPPSERVPSPAMTKRRSGEPSLSTRTGPGDSGHIGPRGSQDVTGKRTRSGLRDQSHEGRDGSRGMAADTGIPMKKRKGSGDDRRSPHDGEMESRRRKETTGSRNYDYERPRGRFDGYTPRYEETRFEEDRYQRPQNWSNRPNHSNMSSHDHNGPSSSNRERDSRRFDSYGSHRRDDEYWQDRERGDRERERNDKRYRANTSMNAPPPGPGNNGNGVNARRRRRG